MFGEAMVHSVTGAKTPSAPKKADSPPLDNGHRPGIISVIDTQTVSGNHVSNVFIKYICLAWKYFIINKSLFSKHYISMKKNNQCKYLIQVFDVKKQNKKKHNRIIGWFISEIWNANFIYYLCRWFIYLYDIEKSTKYLQYLFKSLQDLFPIPWKIFYYCLCLVRLIPLSTGLGRLAVHITYADVVSLSRF